jgi:quercetin dioxygenase-like cupin family protein
LIVDDELLHAEYISSAPGAVVSKRFHPDTRAWWVVMDGEIQFEIEGQEAFIARRGSIVQAPKQTIFSFKTIGDKPSLRYEVNIAKAATLYPKSESPIRIPGFEFTTIKLTRQPAPYANGNKPHVTFDELAQNPAIDQRGLYVRTVINDDRANSGFIYGYEKGLPPLARDDRGHYHTSGAESWIILAGQIRYAIEGQAPFIAEVGDVVYVPPFVYHSPRFYGDAPACRLAMNGYVSIAHLWDVPRD